MKILQLKYLLLLNALLISSTAAFFSVTGLAKLFVGSFWSIVIMASGLEIAKVVSISFLYRYWDHISKAIKLYLFIAIFTLIIITGIGVYGWLSYSFSVTINKINYNKIELLQIENKKQMFTNTIQFLTNNIDNLNNKNVILQQRIIKTEERIDSFNLSTKKRYYAGVNNLTHLDKEITKNNGLLMKYELDKQALMDSLLLYSNKIEEVKLNTTKNELGPLQFLSTVFGIELEQVVNILILIIIFVFDPLAIVLLLGYNQLSLKDKKEKREKGIDVLFDKFRKKDN